MVREPLPPQHPRTIASVQESRESKRCLECDRTDPASKTGVVRVNICALELRLSPTIPEGDSSTVDLNERVVTMMLTSKVTCMSVQQTVAIRANSRARIKAQTRRVKAATTLTAPYVPHINSSS